MSLSGLMRRLQAGAILVGCPSGVTAVPPSVDNQVWSELDATYPMATNWSATAIFTTRMGNDLPNPTLTAGGALSDRNRLEQLEGLPGAPARYRNRAGADWHIPGQHALIDIFIADEVFYDFYRDRWTRNRAQVGLQIQPAPNSRLQTYYMRQHNAYGAPDRLNVLGVTFQFDIKR